MKVTQVALRVGVFGVRRAFLFVLVWLCVSVCGLAMVGVPAGAAILHKPLFQINEVPTGAPLAGPLQSISAMTVDSGKLYLAEDDSPPLGGAPISRTDVFDGSSGVFVEQLPQPLPPLKELYAGVGVGHAFGTTQAYVAGGELEGGVGVFVLEGAQWKQLGAWNGESTPSTRLGGEAGSGKLAVDGSSRVGDWAAGDVYVADAEDGVVDVFEPEVAVDGKYVEKYVTQLTGFTAPGKVTVDDSTGDVLVVDSTSSGQVVDVFEPEPLMKGVYKQLFTLSSTPEGAPFSPNVELGVAVDGGNGDIYISSQGAKAVYEFSPTGVYEGSLTGWDGQGGKVKGAFNGPVSVAVDAKTHDVYVGDFQALQPAYGVVDVFGPGLVIPDVSTGAVTGLSASSVVLGGSVIPDPENAGTGTVTCEFEWGTSKAFGHVTPCPGSPGEGPVPVPVSAVLDGLEPDTTYFYRLVASNGNGANGGEEFEDGQFTTLGPKLDGEFVSEVSSSSVSFGASIDPHGTPTSYYFQYGSSDCAVSPSACTNVPVTPTGIGSGEGDVLVSRHVQGLSVGQTYHYRVVAFNEVDPVAHPGAIEEFAGPDRVFRTQSVGGSLQLPDGREWEQVTPSDKHGAIAFSLNARGVTQASIGGGAFTYLTNSPTEEHAQGYEGKVQVFATRGASGWVSRDIATPHNSPVGIHIDLEAEYPLFSEDLSLSLVEPPGVFTPLTGEVFPQASERTVYLRHDATCVSEPSTCYLPLMTGAPGYANVPEGTTLDPEPTNPAGSPFLIKGATPDLAHVVLQSQIALTKTRPLGNGGDALYEWSAGGAVDGSLQPVSVLPGESEPAPGPVKFGVQSEGVDSRHAISDDGSRVFWTWEDGHHLYMRDTAKGETIQIDAVQPGASGEGRVNPLFQSASVDGSRVFFTDSQRLSVSSGLAGEDLYECEILEGAAGKLECKLRDLAPEGTLGSANVEHVVPGVSDDGSYLYFVARGALSTEENANKEKVSAGGYNLYTEHYKGATGTGEWEPVRFIASLSSADGQDWSINNGETNAYLNSITARVSPDGRFFAFMSEQPLTGYDNRDAVSGVPDQEVYLYDFRTDRLVCASCDPTGARPVGVEQISTTGHVVDSVLPDGQWYAANVPGWTGLDEVDALHQSRYLSDNGRLFFNSSDALVPQDVNGNEDVYEYDPLGVGSCKQETDPTFSKSSGGCVGLISSGTAAEESGFLDASAAGGRDAEGNEGGGDVFFLTGEKLVSSDNDDAYDVYDAHECSSSSPCIVPPPVGAPACGTAEACRAAPAPQPAIFGDPSSATFAGIGNLTSPPGTGGMVTKSKALTRTQKLARALNACRRRDRAHSVRRAVCERSARKEFGTGKARKSVARNRGGK